MQNLEAQEHLLERVMKNKKVNLKRKIGTVSSNEGSLKNQAEEGNSPPRTSLKGKSTLRDSMESIESPAKKSKKKYHSKHESMTPGGDNTLNNTMTDGKPSIMNRTMRTRNPKHSP